MRYGTTATLRYSSVLFVAGYKSCITNGTTDITSKLRNLLFVASITKDLSRTGGTRNLDAYSFPLSQDLVLQVLRRNSLDASKKLDFFRWCSLQPDYKHSAEVYSQMFQTIALYCHNHHYLEEILNLLNCMKQDGVTLDSATFKLLLDAFIKSGNFDSAIDILDHMDKELKIMGTSSNCLNINIDVYDSVIIALVHKNQLSLALSIVFKILDSSGVGDTGNGNHNFPNAIACNKLLVALRKANMKVEFKQVFDKIRELRIFPLDTWGYNICIHAFGLWGDLATSFCLFKEMKESNMVSGEVSCAPDICTYNSLIHVLCMVGKVNDALIVWEELKDSGHEPDSFTYCILIQACSKSYRMDDATKIFHEMQCSVFHPDTIVYNTLLDGFLKSRKLTEACHVFYKMVDDRVRASCWTYNILIDGLLKNGRAAAGYALFCDLKKKGQLVDEVTYSIIILHLCSEGELEEALLLVEEMEVRGFVVDLVTITSLLVSLYRQGRWNWTERLLKHIRDGNLVLSVLRWKSSMEASMKSPQSREKDFMSIFPSKDDLPDILGLHSLADTKVDSDPVSKGIEDQDEESPSSDFDKWSSSPYMDMLANKVNENDLAFQRFSLSRGRRVNTKDIDSFDVDMVNTYLSIFLAKGKLSLACKLFEIFTNMGVDPVGYTYNSMMSSFVKKGYFNEAWSVLHEMDEKVCPADIATYNVIIQGLGKMGRADLANAVLDKLMKQGGYLDIVMYNTLINALGKAGRVDEASKFFHQMRTSGINPDVVTYNTLIEVHRRAGRLNDAYKFLKMMLDAGCVPNHITDTTLDNLEKAIEEVRYQKASIKRFNRDGSS